MSGPTRGQAAGARWRQTSWGLHVPAETARTVEQRIVEAAARISGGGMVTGWGALRLAGARYFDGLAADCRTDLPVPLLLPHGSRLRAGGVLVERTRRALPEPVMRYGVPCVPTAIALLHELVRATHRRTAGVMVDMALAAQVVDLSTLHACLAERGRVPAVAAYALERACGECRSPKESEMLQVWEDEAGLPRPLMNREVLDLDGRVIAIVDLLDVEAGVCGEYNGSAHRSRARQSRDETRYAALRDVGLEAFTVVAGDGVATQVDRMRAARRRALWEPMARRRWRVGATVLADPLPEDLGWEAMDSDEQAAHDAIMRAFHDGRR